MADGEEEAAQPNNGRGYVFREPQTWDRGRPNFLTDNYEDLLDYVEEIAELIRLLDVEDDQEKKRLFVKYLPYRKKQNWMALDEFTDGTYEEFKAAVAKSYPEILTDFEGSLEALNKVCKVYRGVAVTDEGKLRRFGIEFVTIAKKLMEGRSLLTNVEACRKYLNTLDPIFAAALRMTITSTQLVKSTLAPEVAVAGAAAAVPARRGDPVKIVDLIKMAETMAETQDAENRVPFDMEIQKRPDSFPSVKIERAEAKIEELGETLNYLRDAFVSQQKNVDVKHTELMNKFTQFNQQAISKDRPPHEGLPSQHQSQGSGSNQARQSYDSRPAPGNKDACYYCDKTDHFSRDCVGKHDHMGKQWLVVEDGKTKLGDGNFIPRGPGSQKQRVEEYWRKKVSNVNWYATSPVQNFYQSHDSEQYGNAVDMAHDEIHTLKVQLARARQGNQQAIYNAQLQTVQPQFMATTGPVAAPTNSGDIVQALQTFFLKGIQGISELPSVQEQYALTRGALKNGANAPNF
jgi:hypothetical protein